MKKILLAILISLFPLAADAQIYNPLWKISGGLLTPVISTWGVSSAATATSTFSGPLYVSTTGSFSSVASYLRVGSTTAPGYVKNFLADFIDSQNDFLSVNSWNLSAGPCATADFAVSNDIGNSASNFGDIGHTSSTFTGTGCVNNPFTGFKANSTFIYDPNGWMTFALASTSNASFQWLTGGYDATNTKMTLTNSGRLGVSSSTPFATISASTTIGVIPVAISTTTPTSASTTLFMIDQAGDVHLGGGTPTLSSCGTAPTLGANSTDQAGTVTFGSAATGCTITFSVPKLSVPHCVVSGQSMSLTNALTYTETASALTLTEAAAGGLKFDYICALGH